MSSTYLDRPGVSHGSTCAFRYDELCALSLSATVATRARRDTCDLLVSLLSLNSAPLANCARTATRRRSLYRCSLRARKYPQPRCHTSSFASTAQCTSTRRQLPPPHRSGAPLAPCTGLALLRSLRTHSDAAAIALPNPAARTRLSFSSWTFVLCPSLAGTFFFFFFAARLATPARAHAFRGASCHTSTHARAARARTTPSDERYDVRSAGVADWKTAARGNTERTLTA